jgi:two-component system nitrate/nitrite sensor histidine kinase NarX
VTVRLLSTGAGDEAPHVTLAVTDNGAGFDVSVAGSGSTVGLKSMAERAQKIGAVLDVHSRQGRGTTVKVVLGHEQHPH